MTRICANRSAPIIAEELRAVHEGLERWQSCRSFIFLDQLQPQTLCYMSSRGCSGSLPRANMAAQIIEVAPGLDIEALTDIAVKHTDVKAGILVVERQFGYLEFHSRDTSAVKGISGSCVTRRAWMRPLPMPRKPRLFSARKSSPGSIISMPF